MQDNKFSNVFNTGIPSNISDKTRAFIDALKDKNVVIMVPNEETIMTGYSYENPTGGVTIDSYLVDTKNNGSYMFIATEESDAGYYYGDIAPVDADVAKQMRENIFKNGQIWLDGLVNNVELLDEYNDLFDQVGGLDKFVEILPKGDEDGFEYICQAALDAFGLDNDKTVERDVTLLANDLKDDSLSSEDEITLG